MEVSRQRRWQLKQMDAHKCIICGGALVNLTHCQKHRDMTAASQRKRYRMKVTLARAGV